MFPCSSHFIPSGMPSSITPEPMLSKNIRPFAIVPSGCRSKTRMWARGVSLMYSKDSSGEKLHELVDSQAQVEKLATGFTFTEGPIWNKQGRYLLFSDMPADIRRRWSQEDGVTEVANPSNKGNGMTYDAGGRLLVDDFEQ